MNSIPHAPQKAPVTERAETVCPRPKELALALQLLWCQWLASVLVQVTNLGWMAHLKVLIQVVYAAVPLQKQNAILWQQFARGYAFEDFWTDPLMLGIVIRTAVVAALWAGLISWLNAGRNWARVTVMFVFVLGVLSTIVSIPAVLHFPMLMLEPAVCLPLQGVAVYFLLKAPVRAWFKPGPQPRQAGLAVQLLWAQLVASAVLLFNNLGWTVILKASKTLSYAGKAVPDDQATIVRLLQGNFLQTLWTVDGVSGILIRATVLMALWVWLIPRLAAGRGGARAIAVALWVAGLLSTVATLPAIRDYPVLSVEPVVSAVLQAIAIVLLLKSPVHAGLKGVQAA